MVGQHSRSSSNYGLWSQRCGITWIKIQDYWFRQCRRRMLQKSFVNIYPLWMIMWYISWHWPVIKQTNKSYCKGFQQSFPPQVWPRDGQVGARLRRVPRLGTARTHGRALSSPGSVRKTCNYFFYQRETEVFPSHFYSQAVRLGDGSLVRT